MDGTVLEPLLAHGGTPPPSKDATTTTQPRLISRLFGRSLGWKGWVGQPIFGLNM